MTADAPLCRRCGHIRDWHEHFRDDSDCGACGPALCPAYQRHPPAWVTALIDVFAWAHAARWTRRNRRGRS